MEKNNILTIELPELLNNLIANKAKIEGKDFNSTLISILCRNFEECQHVWTTKQSDKFLGGDCEAVCMYCGCSPQDFITGEISENNLKPLTKDMIIGYGFKDLNTATMSFVKDDILLSTESFDIVTVKRGNEVICNITSEQELKLLLDMYGKEVD